LVEPGSFLPGCLFLFAMLSFQSLQHGRATIVCLPIIGRVPLLVSLRQGQGKTLLPLKLPCDFDVNDIRFLPGCFAFRIARFHGSVMVAPFGFFAAALASHSSRSNMLSSLAVQTSVFEAEVFNVYVELFPHSNIVDDAGDVLTKSLVFFRPPGRLSILSDPLVQNPVLGLCPFTTFNKFSRCEKAMEMMIPVITLLARLVEGIVNRATVTIGQHVRDFQSRFASMLRIEFVRQVYGHRPGRLGTRVNLA